MASCRLYFLALQTVHVSNLTELPIVDHLAAIACYGNAALLRSTAPTALNVQVRVMLHVRRVGHRPRCAGRNRSVSPQSCGGTRSSGASGPVTQRTVAVVYHWLNDTVTTEARREVVPHVPPCLFFTHLQSSRSHAILTVTINGAPQDDGSRTVSSLAETSGACAVSVAPVLRACGRAGADVCSTLPFSSAPCYASSPPSR
jgi:hypothetical protein